MVFFSKIGRTIPEDVLNPYSLSAEGVTSNDNLSPAIFAINKSTGEVFMFEVRTGCKFYLKGSFNSAILKVEVSFICMELS